MYKKDLKTKYYIIKDGEILGRCWGQTTAYKLCFLLGAARCCIYEHLLELDDDWFYQLWKEYVGELPPPPMHVEKMAPELFAAIDKAAHTYLVKPSCKEVLRAMYEYRHTYTREEIDLMIPGVKWDSIRVALTQLRREGVNIKHTGDGFYVRQ
jgi:hypothetical protein